VLGIKKGFSVAWLLAIGMVCAAPARAAGDWVVAQVASFSGTSAQIGNDLRAGAMVAFNAANARGGVAGRKLRLVVRDDEQQPDKALAAIRALVEQAKPIALFGLSSNEASLALLQARLPETLGLPLVGPRAGVARVMEPGPAQVFVTRASYRDEIKALFQHCEMSGMREVVLVHQKDEVGTEILALADALATQHGLRLVARVAHDNKAKRDTQAHELPNVREAIDAALRVPHQAVLFAVTDPTVMAAMVASYQRDPRHAVMMALSSADGRWIAERVGSDRARGLLITQTVPAAGSASAALLRRFANDLKLGGASEEDAAEFTVNSVMLEGYVSAQVLIEGLRRAGSNADPARLGAALQALRGFDIGGFDISFGGSSRQGSRFVEVAILGRQGELVR